MRALQAAVSLVALGAVGWWIARQDAPQFPDAFSGWLWLVAALATVGTGLALRGWRWHRIMALAHIPHARRDAFGLLLVAYMGNTVLPARGGEVLRIALLGPRTPALRREILGSVIAERMLDAAVLACLFAVLTLAGVGGAPTGRTPALIAALALALGGAALAGYLALRRRGRFERFAERVRPVARASKIFARPSGIPLAGLSTLAWLADSLTLLLISRALGPGLSLL
jgi:glycosyltransferase 2 family protein